MGYIQSRTTAMLGLQVFRATKALPQTATEALFSVTGGRILLTQILGEVTTAIQNQANNTKLQANPTVTGSSVDICAVLDIAALTVGTLLGITGTFATAMQSGLSIVGQLTPTIIQAGTIDLVTAASNTGAVKWMIIYQPLDAAAIVAAA